MLELIQSVNSAVNNFIWGVPAMICIIGVGLLLTIKTKFLQIRKFPYAMKEILPELPVQSQSVVLVLFSGCGFLLFLECVRNFPK